MSDPITWRLAQANGHLEDWNAVVLDRRAYLAKALKRRSRENILNMTYRVREAESRIELFEGMTALLQRRVAALIFLGLRKYRRTLLNDHPHDVVQIIAQMIIYS